MAHVNSTADPTKTRATGADVLGRRLAESTAVNVPATSRSGVQNTATTVR